eukprot:6489555-Alexandrium_andersonii.AAC.1
MPWEFPAKVKIALPPRIDQISELPMPERADSVPLDAPHMPPISEEEAGDVDAVGDLSSLPPPTTPASPPRFAVGGSSSSRDGAAPPVVERQVEEAPAQADDSPAAEREARA